MTPQPVHLIILGPRHAPALAACGANVNPLDTWPLRDGAKLDQALTVAANTRDHICPACACGLPGTGRRGTS